MALRCGSRNGSLEAGAGGGEKQWLGCRLDIFVSFGALAPHRMPLACGDASSRTAHSSSSYMKNFDG